MQRKLDHITIKGFRSLAHIVKLRLNDVNVLIGANGSGKSNFVEAFSFFRLQWRHRGSDAFFDAAALSDGTLRFIALSTLFLQPGDLRPSIVLLDEPELGLHPYAIAVLSSVIKSVSTETQVLLATQSSTLLDHFEPSDVLVAERVDGSTRLNRLDGDRLESWLGRYSLGQLWEKNELGGRPASECRHFDSWLTCLERTVEDAKEQVT